MSYKLIVLVASGEAEDERAFDAAAHLAKLQQGHVRVIPVYPDPAADLVYFAQVMNKATGKEAAALIRESQRETQARLDHLAREAAVKHGLTYSATGAGPSIAVDQRELAPASALAEAAVLADVMVIGADCAHDSLVFGALFTQTLLTSRTPVFLVKDAPLNFARVGIAWDGSNQAGRAVKAALPVLHTAKEIFVLQHPTDIEHARDAARPDTLITYLARHGLTNAYAETVKGHDVAAALLDACREANCGLLVAGGYGRPRLLELVLGGTTRSLVNEKGRPHLVLAN